MGIAGRLLGIYQQILAGEDVPTDDSREQLELILAGLVVNQQGHLKIKNLIYQEIFNSEWTVRQLENLRPYAQYFKAWIASQQQDESQLLKGVALQEALAWSEDKKLSDLDYRFLAASQELTKREIESNLAEEKQARQIEREKAQFALQVTKQSHKILAEARNTAKQNIKKLYLGRNWIVDIAGGGLTGIAYFAFLQGWWIPVVPPAIGLVIAAVLLPVATVRHLEKIQLCQTVELLVAITKEQPTAGQIALEYLKQAESQENQSLIERILQEEKIEDSEFHL